MFRCARPHLDEDLANYAMSIAQKTGADYAEVRLQRNRDTECLLKNGVPEPAVLVDSYGLGMRVLVEGALGFAATNDLSRGNIRRTAAQAVKTARASLNMVKESVRFSPEKLGKAKWQAEEKEKLEDVGVDRIFKLLRELDGSLTGEKHGVSFPNRMLFAITMVEEKLIVNSDGAELQSRVPRFQFYSYLAAIHGGKSFTVTLPPGYSQLAESGGWEVVDRLHLHNFVSTEAENLAQAVKAEQNPPSETVDVILGPEVTGLVSHESSGHPGEADRILGREAAQAGESYLKKGDIDYQVGSSEAFVSDDPTLPHSMGFYLYDDEGVRARKRRLIEAGTIKEILHNRATAFEFRLTSNGSSRASLFDREPIVRMANTYVEPGDSTLDEILKGVRRGVHIKSFMEWNIDDKRLNQRYVGLEAYLVENGEVTTRLKSPVLEITTPKFWGSIDARGKDLVFRGGHCGKGDPMQAIPVWTGGPTVRLRGLRVGRR